ncbi:MAG TPA: CBS domain-containing protein [Dermatophilaceae bacterium]
MLVREIMTSPAYSVLENTSLEAALRLMATARVTSLPVVDGSGRVVGVISEADLLKQELEPDPRAHVRPARQPAESLLTMVRQVMTASPHTVRQDSDVAELAHTFAITSWKMVPVVQGDLLLGVVSRSDVIRAMSSSDQEIAAEISRTLTETGLRAWQVDVTDGVAHVTGTGSERERGAAISIAQSVKGVRHVTAQAAQP